MNIKQIAIATSLLISSSSVIGATYYQDEELMTYPRSPLENQQNSFFDLEITSQHTQAKIYHDYTDVLTLLKKNKLEDAENKINTLIKQNPEEPEFYNLHALLKSLRKNNALAITSFQKAIKLDPKNLTAHLGLTTLLIHTGNLSQANKYANISLSINNKPIYAYLLLADISKKQNNQKETEKLLLTALKKAQGSPQQEVIVANNLAKLYLIQKQPEKILTLAQGTVTRYPNNSSALSFQANAQLANNQLRKSIQTLEKLINKEKKDIKHRLLLAKLLLKQPENNQQVIKLLDEVTAISPNNPQVLIQKTVYLTKMGYFPEALSSANRIKQLIPNTGLAEALEGDIYLTEKKLDQALAAYQKAYKIKPTPETLNAITNIMVTQGKQTQAINFLNNELKSNPRNLDIHFELASIYEKQNNIRGTEKHYQAILAEQPNNALILNNLAWLYHQENNKKALVLAEKAYQIAPKSADIADTYGSILVQQGELKRAIKVLEQANKLAPMANNIQYHLANAYYLNGNYQQAQAILQPLVKSKQNFTQKNAAIRLLKKLEN